MTIASSAIQLLDSLRMDALVAGALTGPTALVMIRPTGVKLTSNGSAERHLSGRATDAAFRGRGYEHAIDINGTTRLTGVFADVPGQEGRDRRPAQGSGRLSPVPGRALENFG